MSGFTKTINFSLGELCSFLFKKKKCPYCNQKLIRKDKNKSIKKGWIKNPLNFPSDFSFHHGSHYKKEIIYYCNYCNRPFSLEDLGKSE